MIYIKENINFYIFKKFSLIYLLFIFLLMSCAHNRVTMSPQKAPGQSNSRMMHFFLWGLAPNYVFTTAELCGENGVYQVHSYTSVIDGILAIFTGGLYSPKTLDVQCNAIP